MDTKVKIRTMLLIVLAVCALLFAYNNYERFAYVWPFGQYRLIIVIAVSLVLGIGIGVLGHSLLGLLRGRNGRPVETQPLPLGDREHPGRP